METLLLAVNGVLVIGLMAYACFLGIKVDYLLDKLVHQEVSIIELETKVAALLTRGA